MGLNKIKKEKKKKEEEEPCLHRVHMQMQMQGLTLSCSWNEGFHNGDYNMVIIPKLVMSKSPACELFFLNENYQSMNMDSLENYKQINKLE